MSRDLYLFCQSKLRPAKSDDDRDRPLNDKGTRRAHRLGVWLAQNTDGPNVVICSPAQRAVVATQSILKAGGHHAVGIQTDERLYSGAVGNQRTLLAEIEPGASRILLVGHAPVFGRLADYLCQGANDADPELVFDPGVLLRMTIDNGDDAFSAGRARLVARVHARDLPKQESDRA